MSSNDSESTSQESPDSEAPAVIPPLEVKITNKDKPEQKDTTYDSHDADEYQEHKMSQKDIEEFENGDT